MIKSAISYIHSYERVMVYRTGYIPKSGEMTLYLAEMVLVSVAWNIRNDFPQLGIIAITDWTVDTTDGEMSLMGLVERWLNGEFDD